MSAEQAWKTPPAGVPTTPDPDRPYAPLSDATRRLGMDRRTLMNVVIRGGGWARPGPKKLRWYVYTDAIPSTAPTSADDRISRLESVVGELRNQIAELRGQLTQADAHTDELTEMRARVVEVSAVNLQLLSAQDDLEAAAKLALSAGSKYREALAQTTIPGNIAALIDGSIHR